MAATQVAAIINITEIYIMNMKKETWKPVEDFNAYEISNLGRVRNRKSKTIKKTVINKNTGYEMVMLFGKGKPVNCYVHRLVAKAFLDNPNRYTDVDHIDSNRANNIATNLRWVMHRDNVAGRGKYSTYKNRRIKQICAHTGTVLAVWNDFVDAARNLGVNPYRIALVLDKSNNNNILWGNRLEFVDL